MIARRVVGVHRLSPAGARRSQPLRRPTGHVVTPKQLGPSINGRDPTMSRKIQVALAGLVVLSTVLGAVVRTPASAASSYHRAADVFSHKYCLDKKIVVGTATVSGCDGFWAQVHVFGIEYHGRHAPDGEIDVQRGGAAAGKSEGNSFAFTQGWKNCLHPAHAFLSCGINWDVSGKVSLPGGVDFSLGDATAGIRVDIFPDGHVHEYAFGPLRRD